MSLQAPIDPRLMGRQMPTGPDTGHRSFPTAGGVEELVEPLRAMSEYLPLILLTYILH